MKIAIINQKGGSGKSTITYNLAVALIKRGLRVTIIDTDRQQSTMDWFQNRQEYLEENNDLLAVIYPTLAEIQQNISKISSEADIVLIDGTPSVNDMSQFAALNSDLIITPLRPTAIELASTVAFIQHLPSNAPQTLLLTRCPSRPTNHSKEVTEALLSSDIDLFKTQIKSRVAYEDCFQTGMGVLELKDKKAKDEMNALCDEVLNKINIEAMA
ncbi:MAG: ParA family protein [Lentisphaeraceae bacterium]|nr:ParA family protein [Lentisphaeraceae bacterium]